MKIKKPDVDTATLFNTEEGLSRLEARVRNRVHHVNESSDISRIVDRFARITDNDIAPIPEPVNPDRKNLCATSFKLFCEEYFPNRFSLKWSQTHLDSLQVMQDAVLGTGGYYALAEPRGGGKTSRAECLALWALLYGYRRFVVCVGATSVHSVELYKSVLTELETNERLVDDFPEVCYPIKMLEGSYIRAKQQHIEGTKTHMELKADSLVFPYIEGKKTSGSAIKCVSITGRIRGLKRTIVYTGEVIRPDFVIIDDPQTDKSAKSPKQVEERERSILGSILGLAGPGKEVTAIMPCTVIRPDDLAERFLDHERRPEWRGKRTPMLFSFPTNMVLWEEYAEIRANGFRENPEGRGIESTQFYLAHREEMDAGASASWPDRFNPITEVSAIQHAMNLWIKDPRAFAAEYQNQPLIESNGEHGRIELNAKEIIKRASGLDKFVVPRNTQFLTMGIDIQQRIVYYLIAAWTDDFGGSIVDYGTYPRQTINYFSANEVPITLETLYPNLALGPRIYKALEYLRDNVVTNPFLRDESENDVLKVEKCLIDANWNLSADAVYAFCKENQGSNIFGPSHGKGIIASMVPMDSWTKQKNEGKPGNGWRVRNNTQGVNRGRHTIFDTNFWKSKIAERLAAPKGSSNALLLPGTKQFGHQLLADHLASESSITTHGRGRDVNEWKMKPGSQENHWFDCLIMSAVGASQMGLELHDAVIGGTNSSIPAPKPLVRPRVDLSALKKKV